MERSVQSPVRLNRPDLFARSLSDWLLTEQRKTRKARRGVKQMHGKLVQPVFDGSYEPVADTECRYLVVNFECRRMVGL